MGIARNIARLVPNGSGLLPNANIEAVAASKLTGQVADENAPSGSVIQVGYVSSSTEYSTSSTSFQATNVSLSFTPSSATSKIILQSDVVVNFTLEPGGFKTRFYDVTAGAQIGNIYNCGRMDMSSVSTNVYFYTRAPMFWRLDSWGTSAKTIRVEFGLIEGSGSADFNTGYPATQSTQFIIWEIAP